MVKNFVLDTNVLIHEPTSIFSFADNNVILPIIVIEELDNLKKMNDVRGGSARAVSRVIDKFREKGNLIEGVKMENGGCLKVIIGKGADLPHSFADKADNFILSLAVELNKKEGNVVFISKDINMRIKAQVLGLAVEDYEKSKINFSELYNGWREVPVSDGEIDKFYSDGSLKLSDDFFENEFLILKSSSDEKHTALARCKKGAAVKLINPKMILWGVKALNVQQSFAMDCLVDDKIKLVTFLGHGKDASGSGCGSFKSFR